MTTLGIRMPKPIIYGYNSHNPSSQSLGGATYYKQDVRYGLIVAPRAYGAIRRCQFALSVQNQSTTTDLVCRLRVWTTEFDRLNPEVRTLEPGDAVSGAASGWPSVSILPANLFLKQGPISTIPHTPSSGSSGVVTIEFDVFEAADQDFWTFWDVPVGKNDYVQIFWALEVISGPAAGDVACWTFQCTPIYTGSSSNATKTYVPMMNLRNLTGSGRSVYWIDEPSANNKRHGMWAWQYNEDEWDGITEVCLLIGTGAGGSTAEISFRLDRVINPRKTPTVTTLFTQTTNVITNETGFFKTTNLVSLLTDGDWFCVDWRFNSGGGSGAASAEQWIMLEITQEKQTKSATYFHCFPNYTRQVGTLALMTPQIFQHVGYFDPLMWANFPDSRLISNEVIAGMYHVQGAFQSNIRVITNSNLTEDQNGPQGVTPTTLFVAPLPVENQKTDEWVYRQRVITSNDPINLAGGRKLIFRDEATADNPQAHAGLKYVHQVPDREVLPQGPLFPTDPFVPEGCAATSAGLGDPGKLIITNGASLPQHYDPASGKVENNGVPPPFCDETLPATQVDDTAASPTGGLVPGVYKYRYTLRNCCTGSESDPNNEDIVVDASAASPRAKVTFSFAGVRIPGDAQICEICIYRTQAGGDFPVMAKVGCFDPDETSTFVDSLEDEELDFTSDALIILNAPMPCVPVVVEFRNRLFGFGDIPARAPAGTVSATNGSKIVVGDAEVEWDRCLEGKYLQITGDCRRYEIDKVLPPAEGTSPPIGRLKLLEEYEGDSVTAKTYTICGRPNRVYFSEPLEPEYWPLINFIDLEPGDGDRLMGGFSNFNRLVICKRRKTYALTFRSNPVTEFTAAGAVPARISSDIGCIGPRTFAQVENGTVWLAERGLALYDGRGVQHVPESEGMNDIFINPDNERYVRRDSNGRVIDAVGVFYPKREQYLLLLPTKQTTRGCNLMLVWDVKLRNITLLEFCQEFQSMVVAKDSSGDERVYMGDTNGFVWIFDIGLTDGVGSPNATGTVRGTVGAAGFTSDTGAAFLDDSSAKFLTGGVPGLGSLSGVVGLTPSWDGGDLGLAGVCVFVRASDADLDGEWQQRFVVAASETRLFVTPAWDPTPAAGWDYMIGAIEFRAVFKPWNQGSNDRLKRDWEHVLVYDPQDVSSQLRVELVNDLGDTDTEELTVRSGDPPATGEGRTFDVSLPGGRQTRPAGRRIRNFLQIKMKNFAPEEPISIINHVMRTTPRQQ